MSPEQIMESTYDGDIRSPDILDVSSTEIYPSNIDVFEGGGELPLNIQIISSYARFAIETQNRSDLRPRPTPPGPKPAPPPAPKPRPPDPSRPPIKPRPIPPPPRR